MSVNEQAVQAAQNAYRSHPGDSTESHRAALTAALPFLTGVKVKELEEAARNACMYLETGFIECPKCGEEVETKHTDAEYTLRSALSSQPVADGWVPIETAPKDGTPVLVHFVPNEVPSLKPLICAAYWEKSDGLMKPGFWRVFHSVGPSFTATHWRPLPASPGASE
ncbi:hypothetical protein [Brucella pseudogrignonensis]|uniref:hypothetical protein n=1 Tax=Brucella pseudogrignonensis TaxID=419475 RepID=UPI0038D01DFA